MAEQTEADRIAAFARWLKQYGEENYTKWTQPTQEPLPTVDDLHRLGLCNGVNHARGVIQAKFFELFIDADVNWADVFDCDIAFDQHGREWHRSHPIIGRFSGDEAVIP